jgi:hypothetical protein
MARLRVVIVRRLSGFLLAGFMLHLNVERADLACALHSDHVTPAPAAHAHGAAHDAMNAAHHGVAESESCQTPAQPDCCQALASCSLVLGIDDAPMRVGSTQLHSAVRASVESAPLSRLIAPDPPPPKL